ncbi:hypothetical protein DYB32_008879, partial [Aphanomyces invadans]
IMLARFRLPYAEIKRAILEIDRDILSSEKVAALIQFAPEGDELDTVKAYERLLSTILELLDSIS